MRQFESSAPGKAKTHLQPRRTVAKTSEPMAEATSGSISTEDDLGSDDSRPETAFLQKLASVEAEECTQGIENLRVWRCPNCNHQHASVIRSTAIKWSATGCPWLNCTAISGSTKRMVTENCDRETVNHRKENEQKRQRTGGEPVATTRVEVSGTSHDGAEIDDVIDCVSDDEGPDITEIECIVLSDDETEDSDDDEPDATKIECIVLSDDETEDSDSEPFGPQAPRRDCFNCGVSLTVPKNAPRFRCPDCDAVNEVNGASVQTSAPEIAHHPSPRGRVDIAESYRLKPDAKISCDDVSQALESITIPKNVSRKNVRQSATQTVTGMCLGVVNARCYGIIASTFSVDRPHLTKLLVHFARQNVPNFKFTSIQVNKNYQSAMHCDKNNLGPSYIVGVGETKQPNTNIDPAGLNLLTCR